MLRGSSRLHLWLLWSGAGCNRAHVRLLHGRTLVNLSDSGFDSAGSVVAVKIFNINRTKDLDDMYSKKNESDLKADNEDNKSRAFAPNKI